LIKYEQDDNVYNFDLDIYRNLINVLSQIDRFDASWTSIEKKEGQSLKQLKSIATVRSVGASTRIEGSKMSDEEVGLLLSDLAIDKLKDRDGQEVVGYFDVLNEISNSYEHIRISENELKGLHNQLLKYSVKDAWHKGDYKQHSNNVEATLADGTTQIVFETTPPGFETDDAMRNLMDWYKWIQYVSFEHEIENRKPEYYRELRKCQAEIPNENITTWIKFFMGALLNIQEQLMMKLEQTGIESNLSPKEKSVLTIIANYPGCKSGIIAKKLQIPNPTIKKILKSLTDKKLIEKHSAGPGTNYTIN